MSKDSFTRTSRNAEDQYFLEREKLLIEKLEKKAAAEAARRDLAEAVGVSDDEILDALEELGYTRDIVIVLHLFPLVAVAWADGEISEQERNQILEASKAFDIEPGTPAYQKLLEWLSKKPTQVETERKLRIIGDLLHYRTGENQQHYRTRVADMCRQVAEASGGFLGVGRKVSAAEKEMLERITGELNANHPSAAERLMGSESPAE